MGAKEYVERVHGLSFPLHFEVGDLSDKNCSYLARHFDNVQCGKIEETIHNIDPVDLFILSETLEHLEDPDSILALMYQKADAIFISTPLDEEPGANNEHYWSWGKEDIQLMLHSAGFHKTVMYSELDFRVSRFQLWLVEK